MQEARATWKEKATIERSRLSKAKKAMNPETRLQYVILALPLLIHFCTEFAILFSRNATKVVSTVDKFFSALRDTLPDDWIFTLVGGGSDPTGSASIR